jgi:hypothetical protein
MGIVTEFCERGTLEDEIKIRSAGKKYFSDAELLSILKQTSEFFAKA